MHFRLLRLILFTFPVLSHARNSILQKLPTRYFSQVAQSSKKSEEQVNKRSEKALNSLSRQEKKMQAKLFKIDSIAAENIFTTHLDKIGSLRTGLRNKVASKFTSGEAGPS
jgi:hypothetical protein